MSNNQIKKYQEMLNSDYKTLLNYLKAKYPLFHNSNFFFRDFQYGLRRFLEKKEIEVSYQDAEKLAHELGKIFEQQGIFIKVNNLGWKLNYPEFATTQPGDPL
jgi:Fe-S oxidoreductase